MNAVPRGLRKDLASFREEDVKAVYTVPACFQTARIATPEQPVDKHHILGRGNTQDRTPYSSIFNMAFLRRDIHEGPLRDSPDQRAVYLCRAFRFVMNAVGRGTYTLREEDYAFMKIAEAWLEENVRLFRYAPLGN